MDTFYADIPPFTDFEEVTHPHPYRPVPGHLWVVVSDVRGSTRAIQEGRYKDVNTLGAATVMVAQNTVGQGLPFVFGSGGCAMAAVQLKAQAAGTPQVVFVNFGGPVICDAAGEDSRTNRSFAVCGHFNKCGGCFNFAAYKVDFTTTRPMSGDYTQLVISPSYASNHGVAALDCGNANRNGMAYVFRTADRFYTGIGGGVRAASACVMRPLFGR